MVLAFSQLKGTTKAFAFFHLLSGSAQSYLQTLVLLLLKPPIKKSFFKARWNASFGFLFHLRCSPQFSFPTPLGFN